MVVTAPDPRPKPTSTPPTPVGPDSHGDTDPASPQGARRSRTLAFGAIPILLLGGLLVMDHIPGTDISLTVPYAAEGPGPMFDTLGSVDDTPVVEINGVETDETAGELNMTTVSVRTNMTLPQALGRWLFTNDTLVPIEQIIPPDVDPEQVEQSNQAAFAQSESAATIAAMNYLDVPTKVVVSDLVEDSPAHGLIQTDDVIVDVDGQSAGRPQDIADYVATKAPGDTVTFSLLRDGQHDTVDVTLGEHPENPEVGLVGIIMVAQPEEDITVEYNLQDIGGPSAGMIFSLSVIDQMSPGLLNGGNRVAGTGTITPDGEVGPIGGIKHKVAAAEEDDMDLFLAPAANCAEAVSRDHGDLVIASVTTLEDAIEAMAAFEAGEEFATCHG